MRKAAKDLDRLDRWREEKLGLPPISDALVIRITEYFTAIDLRSYRPGMAVELRGESSGLFLVHLPLTKAAEPYKVFYQPRRQLNLAQVRRIRHPRQKPLKEIKR